MFWADIVFNFFMATENEESNIEHDFKMLSVNYLKGWFMIDFCSVFPFDKVLIAI